MKKFLRRSWDRYSKLGKKRKKKQKWRNPKGRDNKMRERTKGHPKTVNTGYKTPIKKKLVLINNVSELEKVKGKKVMMRKIGKRKKIEIAKKAKEMKISIQNLNVEKFLKKLNNKPKKK